MTDAQRSAEIKVQPAVVPYRRLRENEEVPILRRATGSTSIADDAPRVRSAARSRRCTVVSDRRFRGPETATRNRQHRRLRTRAGTNTTCRARSAVTDQVVERRFFGLAVSAAAAKAVAGSLEPPPQGATRSPARRASRSPPRDAIGPSSTLSRPSSRRAAPSSADQAADRAATFYALCRLPSSLEAPAPGSHHHHHHPDIVPAPLSRSCATPHVWAGEPEGRAHGPGQMPVPCCPVQERAQPAVARGPRQDDAGTSLKASEDLDSRLVLPASSFPESAHPIRSIGISARLVPRRSRRGRAASSATIQPSIGECS